MGPLPPARPPCLGGLTVSGEGGRTQCVGGQLALQMVPSLAFPAASVAHQVLDGAICRAVGTARAQRPSCTKTVLFSPQEPLHQRPAEANSDQ